MRPSEHPAWRATPGWCTCEEGDALYDAARALPPGATVVEVGTYQGRSAIALAMGGARVTTIDSDPDAARRNALAATLATFDLPVAAIYRDARMLAREWDAPIALLYLDGWHDAANVRADYAAWAKYVIPGGAIWFHDAHGAGWPDVTALVEELTASGALIREGTTGTIARCRKAVA